MERMISQEQDVFFLDEQSSPQHLENQKTVKILTVDDDSNFQRSTAFALSTLKVLDCKIELAQAFSYA